MVATLQIFILTLLTAEAEGCLENDNKAKIIIDIVLNVHNIMSQMN